MPISYHISSWLLGVATEQKVSIGFTQLPYYLIFFKQFLELALNDSGTSLYDLDVCFVHGRELLKLG
jgi:hypothetical protein